MNDVLLINPSGTAQMGFSNAPLGLLYIASALEAEGIKTDVIDGYISGDSAIREALKKQYPFVGVTCLTPARHSAINVARTVKELSPSSVTVMGGVHPSVMKKQMEESYSFIDHVIAGDGEYAMVDIVKNQPLRCEVLDLDKIPSPAWNKVNLRDYPARGRSKIDLGRFNGVWVGFEPRVSVEFSRGCTAHCNFCSAWWVKGKYRVRDPYKMADELEDLVMRYGMRHFSFVDDVFSSDREKTLVLCREIVRRKLRIAFHATTRTDNLDEELVLAMKEAGCYIISVGIESGDPFVLHHIHKSVTIETGEKAIHLCRNIGIHINALLIVGNLGETEKSIRATRDFLRRTKPNSVSAGGGLWIFPGTAVYQKALKERVLVESFWLSHVPYLTYTKEHSLETLSHFQDIIYSYSKWVSLKRKIGKILSRFGGISLWVSLFSSFFSFVTTGFGRKAHGLTAAQRQRNIFIRVAQIF